MDFLTGPTVGDYYFFSYVYDRSGANKHYAYMNGKEVTSATLSADSTTQTGFTIGNTGAGGN